MTNYSEAERGRAPQPAARQDANGLPRGGTYPLPHPATFGAQINATKRAYSQRFDESLRYSRTDADRMRIDPVISTCLDVRAFTTSLLPWSIKPEDEADPLQKAAAEDTMRLVRRLPRIVETFRWLNYDGVFSGKSGSFIRFGWGVDRKWQPTAARPVLGDKLAYKWDGTVGVSVRTGEVPGVRVDYLDSTPVYWLTEEERECMVVHRQFAEDTDYLRSLGAGAIHGIGLRQKLYWVWKLKQEIWKMSLDFLQWFAKGLMVYYFESGNDEHLKAVAEWVEKQDGNSAMLFPVVTSPGADGKPYFQKPVERFDVSNASPAFLQSLITDYFDDLFRFIILHQSGTTAQMATGLGSGQSQAHETTFDAVVKMDAICLGETLSLDLLRPMYRANHPGVPFGRWEFAIETPNVAQALETARTIVELGGSVSQENLEETGGVPKAKSTDTILGGPAANQPMAVGAQPDGVPMVSGDQSGQQPVSQ
jgi:hypothetical protein